MWWRHAGVHRARFRELVAGEGLPAELVPEVRRIACPHCGDWYFAELDPAESERFDLEAREWAALVRLEGECPDHPQNFVVED